MSPVQALSLAVAVLALAGATVLNLTGEHADWTPPAPTSLTAELAGFADRTQAWLRLQATNAAPENVFAYASWAQLGVEGAHGTRLRTAAGCYDLRAADRFVLIEARPSCQDALWTEALQVFGASPEAAELNRRLSDGRASGWRGLRSVELGG